MRLSTSVLALAGVALCASPADAATRFVSTTGTGAACTSAAPCAIKIGIDNAVAGDEVRIFPGAYAVSQRLDAPADVTVRGTTTAADTTISSSNPSGGEPTLTLGARARLSDVTVRRIGGSSGLNLFLGDSTAVERVIAENLTPGGEAIRLSQGGLITLDSVLAWSADSYAIIASGPAAGSGKISARFQNLTAVSDGRAAILVGTSATRPVHVDVRDSIFVGTGASDIQMFQNSQNSDPAVLSIRRSFFRPTIDRSIDGLGTLNDFGGNSGSAPIFVNRASRDFRPAAGSPVIDSSSLLVAPHALDVAQRPRLLGGALDAGAAEFAPAPADLTASVQTIGAANATIAAAFATGGLEGSLKIEYGATAAYGQETAPQPTAAGATSAATALSGLTAGGTVHYRAVLTTDGGTTTTADQTFTVPATRNPATPLPAPTPSPAAPVSVRVVTVKAGRVQFSLSAAAVVRLQLVKGSKVKKVLWVEGKAGANTVKLGRVAKGKYTVRVAAASALGSPSSISFAQR